MTDFMHPEWRFRFWLGAIIFGGLAALSYQSGLEILGHVLVGLAGLFFWWLSLSVLLGHWEHQRTRKEGP